MKELKQKLKIYLTILFFGSIWGFLEVTLGEFLRLNIFTADFFGRIMCVAGVTLMFITRIVFKKRGHQLFMGIIASLFRLLYPFVTCVPCSFTAIIIEALIFEIIFLNNSILLLDKKNILQLSSLGVIIFHLTYFLSYLFNQIMFPLFSKTGLFYLDILAILPKALSNSLLPALCGLIIFPFIIILKEFDLKKIRGKVFYPITAGLLIILWISPMFFLNN